MKFYPGLLAISIFIYSSAAADLRPALYEGMSYYEVTSRWGSPVEKFEYETKREAKWLYKSNFVRFKEGKVVKIAAIVDPWDKPIEVKKVKAATVIESENAASEKELLEIFEEIAEGFPGEDPKAKADPNLGKPKIIENKSPNRPR